jgi:hypothetical protein
MVRARGGEKRRLMGRSQVVRQRILIPPFPGSSPGAPASNFKSLSKSARPHFHAGYHRGITRHHSLETAITCGASCSTLIPVVNGKTIALHIAAIDKSKRGSGNGTLSRKDFKLDKKRDI